MSYYDAYSTDNYDDRQLTAEDVENILKGWTIGADGVEEGSIGYAHIKSGSIGEVHIREASINNAMIQNLAVNSAKIADLSVTEAKIDDLAVTTAKLSDASITSAKIQDAQITTAKIQTGAITTALIENSAIGEAQISDASITDAKIVDLSANKLSAGTIDTSSITVQDLDSHLSISGARLQVFDNQATPVERVSIGDVNNDGTVYGLRVRSADGLTVLYDETGVYNEGITNGAITNPKISDGEIDNRVIQANTITGDKLVVDSITGREIKANEVTASHMVAGTITASSGILANASVTTATIADASITNAKIDSLDAGKITTGTLDANRVAVGSGTTFENGYDVTRVGHQLVDLSYETDLSDNPFDKGSIVAPVTEGFADGKNLLKIDGRVMLRSDFIPLRSVEDVYISLDAYSKTTSQSTFYVGIEFYDVNKNSLGTNNLTVYAIGGVPLSANTWTNLDGYSSFKGDVERTKAHYTRLRILTRWSSDGTNNDPTYIRNLKVKQNGTDLSSHMLEESIRSQNKNALDFGGGGDYVQLDDNLMSTMSGDIDYSIEAWIYYDGTPPLLSGGSGGYSIIGHADSYGFGLQLDGNKINLGYRSNSNVSSSGDLVSGKWYHVCGTRNATTGDVKLYINGELDTTSNNSLMHITNTSAPLQIGYADTRVDYFNGMISNVRVWSKVLSDSEVKEAMSGKVGGNNNSGLELDMSLSEGRGSKVYCNHTTNFGTFVSSPEWTTQNKSVAEFWRYPNTTLIDGGNIYANTVTANEINVGQLSAITADLGTVTAGTINGVNINGSVFTQTGTDGEVIIDDEGLKVTDAQDTIRILMQTSANPLVNGVNPAQLTFPAPAFGTYAGIKVGMNSQGDAVFGYFNTSGSGGYATVVQAMHDGQLQLNGGTSTPAGVVPVLINGETSIGANGSVLQIHGNDHCYIELYKEGQFAGRSGFIGYPNSSSNSVEFNNSLGGFNFVGGAVGGNARVTLPITHKEGYFNIQPYNSSYDDGSYMRSYYKGYDNEWYAYVAGGSGGSSLTIRAGSFVTSSTEDTKENITLWDKDLLNTYRSDIDFYEYDLVGESDNPNKKRKHGLVIGKSYKTPSSLISDNGEGVSLYDFTTHNGKAIQQLVRYADKLEQRITELESRL